MEQSTRSPSRMTAIAAGIIEAGTPAFSNLLKNDRGLLMQYDQYNTWTVAHQLAYCAPDEMRLLMLECDGIMSCRSAATGASVAHIMAQFGGDEVRMRMLGHIDLLRLRDSDGRTAAHVLAEYGSNEVWKAMEAMPEVLCLETKGGWSVREQLGLRGALRT